MEINEFLAKINEVIVNPIILLMFAVSLAVFAYGIFEFIWKMGSDEDKNKGKRNISYGILGMFIMVSVFAIIKILLNSFGVPLPAFLQ